MRPANVLHVSNRWGGGIKTVVQQYIGAVPEHRHFLLRNDDPWQVPGTDAELFDHVIELPDGLLAAARALRAAVTEHDIDIVHAHSSFAGALVRTVPLRCCVLYTPNAFATLAPRGSKQWLAGQTERVLGLRPIAFATVGDAESTLARRYSPRSRVVRISNLPAADLRPAAMFGSPARVVMCGRICRQKGVDFFAETARVARDRGSDAEFVWLGDGDPALRVDLERSGVQIAGWLDLVELHRRQAGASVYLHSAIYEGACLSVLDSAALGLPSIGRPVPGVEEVPWMELADTPHAAADLLAALSDEDTWQRRHEATVAQAALLTADRQRAELCAAYETAALSMAS